MAVPDDRNRSNQEGYIVADMTVRRDVITSDDRFGQIAAVIADPIVTRQDAVAIEYAIEDVVIDFGSPSVGISISSPSDDSNVVDILVLSCKSSGFPAIAIQNRNAKYRATTTLSAAIAALVRDPSMFNVSATATLRQRVFFLQRILENKF
jgi:hypothetical protein